MTLNHWTNPTQFCWGIDVSHYRPNLDWPLLKAAGISFVIAKASESTDWQDPAFPDHCQKAYDHDVLFMAYHFMDPVYYTVYNPKATPPESDAQLQNFLRALKNKKVYGTFADHERWWESYDQWYKARRGEITWAEVKKVDPHWVSESTRIFSERVRAATRLPHGVYSSKSFIDGYAPKTLSWVHDYIQFTAYYPYSTAVVAVNSWAEMFEKYMPPFPLRYDLDRDGKAEDHSSPPWWTNKQPEFWQFTGDKFQMPGIQDGRGINLTVDIDLFFGPQSRLYQLYGFIPRGTVTPPPTVGDGDQQSPDPVAMAEVIAMLQELKLTMDRLEEKITGEVIRDLTDIRKHFV